MPTEGLSKGQCREDVCKEVEVTGLHIKGPLSCIRI